MTSFKTLVITRLCVNANKGASAMFLFPVKYLVMGGVVLFVVIIVIVIGIVVGSAATRKCQHGTCS